MSAEHGEHEPMRPNTPAWASLAAGTLAFMTQPLCCFPGLGMIAWVVVPVLTLVALLTGVVGYRQAKDTGDGEGLALLGLVLAGFNVVLDLCWAVLLALGFGMWALASLA